MSKKFRFKLETLLEERRRREDEARHAMQEAQQRLETVEGRIRELQDEIGGIEQQMREGLSRSVSPHEMVAGHDYLGLVRRRLGDEQEALMYAQNDVALKRKGVETALKERKVIENLKEKQYADWLAEREKAERTFLDEQAIVRHFHDNR